jgi:hypothetical protein
MRPFGRKIQTQHNHSPPSRIMPHYSSLSSTNKHRMKGEFRAGRLIRFTGLAGVSCGLAVSGGQRRAEPRSPALCPARRGSRVCSPTARQAARAVARSRQRRPGGRRVRAARGPRGALGGVRLSGRAWPESGPPWPLPAVRSARPVAARTVNRAPVRARPGDSGRPASCLPASVGHADRGSTQRPRVRRQPNRAHAATPLPSAGRKAPSLGGHSTGQVVRVGSGARAAMTESRAQAVSAPDAHGRTSGS